MLMIEPIVKTERLMSKFQKRTAVNSRSGSSSNRATACAGRLPLLRSRRAARRSENNAASLAEKKAEQSKSSNIARRPGRSMAYYSVVLPVVSSNS